MASESAPARHHQRAKSSVIRSFVHRRQPSKGEALVPEPQSAEIQNITAAALPSAMDGRSALNGPIALGELQTNSQDPTSKQYRMSREEYGENLRGRSRSPTKSALSNPFKSREMSPTKPTSPAKQKSSTNLAGLLRRPKSIKGLYRSLETEEASMGKDKENQAPTEELATPPPIFAQFTSDTSVRQQQSARSSMDPGRPTGSQDLLGHTRPVIRERPKSYQLPPTSNPVSRSTSTTSDSRPANSKSARSRAFAALTGLSHRGKASAPTSPVINEPSEPHIDPKDIDQHLEALLDRRNIPENQRFKMRGLDNTIKMEFIRQDWAETRGAHPGITDSVNSKESDSAVAMGTDDEDKSKRTRGRSFTFSRSKKGGSSRSPSKKREGTLGRHFRSKSTDSVVSDGRPTSSHGQSAASSLLSKMKLQQGPGDYVAYLRKVQKPQLVEVGKLHKLRLLLRNETVAWIEDFVQQGGMKEIVGLLKRIMEVEWREEHEDALLHENLLCLKALSTTALAMQYLDTIQADLFPKLLHMIFDPERKGPSEFTTRGIITFVLFTYIESATPAERVIRAKAVLAHLRDPEPKDDQRPLPFVMDMRQQRPYRVWNKEVVSVTKEVFWIFLHNLNVVSLEKKPTAAGEGTYGYMGRHFPQERPPVPAAPYVGGVEWDATNYLASHLDLLNAIIACTPTASQRNALRADMRISGWERLLGGHLRLCKEKFYGSVHDGLRTWVSAADEDGWEVRDVRYGPAPSESPRKASPNKRVEAPAPKIEVPRLDLGLDKGSSQHDGWIE
ncbi:armadillo-type protein [Emericellopsis atlantica]|uniref:Armadillo-type protein n=1 Tax=Emericellopsis atlantica TaxID=2614577 RepID=A0A9P7ZIR7_9HYPO|nr:armadillo-type protein [Emericellopsis atlantica]KAG9252467.1 armadillo-type protein [Emericellopsis atlantica]